MAFLMAQANIDQIIKEIEELIPCEVCGKMATGFVKSDQTITLVVCQEDGYGRYEDGANNAIFFTRNNLLQVAQRCKRAEEGLTYLTALADNCDKMYKKLEKLELPKDRYEYQRTEEELWRAVIDLDIS